MRTQDTSNATDDSPFADEAKAQAFVTPFSPAIIADKPGYKTSEGQFTALYSVAALILGAIGYQTTPDHLGNAFDAAVTIAKTLGPLLTAIPILWHYMTSRGKLKSNAVNALGSVQTAALFSSAGLGGPAALGLFGGGGGFKNPSTYIDLAKIIGGAGVIPGKAGDVITQVLGGPQKPSREAQQPAHTQPQAQRTLTDQQIVAGFENVGNQIADIRATIEMLTKTVYADEAGSTMASATKLPPNQSEK